MWSTAECGKESRTLLWGWRSAFPMTNSPDVRIGIVNRAHTRCDLAFAMYNLHPRVAPLPMAKLAKRVESDVPRYAQHPKLALLMPCRFEGRICRKVHPRKVRWWPSGRLAVWEVVVPRNRLAQATNRAVLHRGGLSRNSTQEKKAQPTPEGQSTATLGSARSRYGFERAARHGPSIRPAPIQSSYGP